MAQANEKRRRLAPEQRVTEILDAAVRLVLTEGVTRLTMDRIASEAGASKALLYNYFPNVGDLLRQVYVRELKSLQRQQLQSLGDSPSFEDIVRVTERANRANADKRELLISRLSADVDIANAMKKIDRENRKTVVSYLSDKIQQFYQLPDEVAEVATRLALKYDIPPRLERHVDEVWGAMIVGAMGELERRYNKQ